MHTNRSTVALVVAVIMTLSGPLFAAKEAYQPCAAARQADCHKTARITQCYCCDDSAMSSQPAVAKVRIEISACQRALVVEDASKRGAAPFLGLSFLPQSPDLPILLVDLRL